MLFWHPCDFPSFYFLTPNIQEIEPPSHFSPNFLQWKRLIFLNIIFFYYPERLSSDIINSLLNAFRLNKIVINHKIFFLSTQCRRNWDSRGGGVAFDPQYTADEFTISIRIRISGGIFCSSIANFAIEDNNHSFFFEF